MMETDDKLIRAFFAEQKQEIPDNGFSRRVMNRLPHKFTDQGMELVHHARSYNTISGLRRFTGNRYHGT